MGIIIGSLADLIFYWFIISPENAKEVAIFISLAVISINLEVVSTTLRRIAMTDAYNLLVAPWKPVENIVSCVAGIVLWNFIEPLSLVGVLVFLVAWSIVTLIIVLAVVKSLAANVF